MRDWGCGLWCVVDRGGERVAVLGGGKQSAVLVARFARRTRRGEVDLAALQRAGWTRRAATAVPDWQQLGDRNSGQCNILQSGYVL